MNFLRFILIIGIFFKEHVGSVELQWDVPQNRKLLITGGAADDPSKDKVASVVSSGKTYTAVSLGGIVVIPAQLSEPLVAKKGDGTTEIKVGSLKIHEGHSFLRDMKLADLPPGKEPESGGICKVLGLDAGKATTIDCTVTAVEEKSFTCKTTGKLCANDIGAGVLCGGNLAGLLKSKAAGGGGGAEGEAEEPAAARRRRDDAEPEAGAGGAAAGGEDCADAYEALNIGELQKLITAEGGSGLATNIRPTYIIAFIPAVILLSFLFVH